jgi:quercetin dioxygenase-like cupin family protein
MTASPATPPRSPGRRVADEYFAAAPADAAAAPGAWYRLRASDGVPVAPGILTRPVAGEAAMLTYVEWERDAVAPTHAHVEEQLVLVLEGEVEFTIGVESRVMRAGDVAVIPSFAEHGGRGLAELTIAVEAFGPRRTSLLERASPPPPLPAPGD